MPYRDRETQQACQRSWLAGRRAEFVVGQVCAACGSVEALELHHRDPAQKLSHRIWSWTRARIVAELAKCEWLCGVCHDRHHAAVRRAEAIARNPHGTRGRYKLGCRCDGCRADNARQSRIQKLKRRLAMATTRESWLAVVQHGDEVTDQETELVTVEYVDGEPRTIELTDGQRITLLAPAEAA